MVPESHRDERRIPLTAPPEGAALRTPVPAPEGAALWTPVPARQAPEALPLDSAGGTPPDPKNASHFPSLRRDGGCPRKAAAAIIAFRFRSARKKYRGQIFFYCKKQVSAPSVPPSLPSPQPLKAENNKKSFQPSRLPKSGIPDSPPFKFANILSPPHAEPLLPSKSFFNFSNERIVNRKTKPQFCAII